MVASLAILHLVIFLGIVVASVLLGFGRNNQVWLILLGIFHPGMNVLAAPSMNYCSAHQFNQKLALAFTYSLCFSKVYSVWCFDCVMVFEWSDSVLGFVWKLIHSWISLSVEWNYGFFVALPVGKICGGSDSGLPRLWMFGVFLSFW